LDNLSLILASYQLELIVSATLSLLTASTLKLRDLDAEKARSPPLVRTVLVMFLAVLGSIVALRHFTGPMCGVALTFFATIAMTVVLVGNRPLLSTAFISAFSRALMVCVLIWGGVVVLRYFSGDMDLGI
jgi:hypothetical protein